MTNAGKICGSLARRIMPVEWIAVAFGILTYFLYAGFDRPMPGQPGAGADQGPGLFYLRQLLTSLDLYALVWLIQVAWFVGQSLSKAAWSPMKTDWRAVGRRFSYRLDFGEIFQDLRFFHAVLVMFVIFGLLKHLIPWVNPNLYDSTFASTDKLLCGGVYCGQLLHNIVGLEAADFVSQNYSWYFQYMSIVLFIMIGQRDRRLAQQYIQTFVLMFLIGILWVYAIPTLGPVYYEPQAFAPLATTEMGLLQQDLWLMREDALRDPSMRKAVNLISGFPSLHVAVALLGTWYLRHFNKILFFLSVVFTVLIIHSTLYLGWHYLLDDVGSLILAWICHRLAKLFSWEWRKKVNEAPGTAA